MKKGSAFVRLASSVDLPEEPIPGRPLVEILDNQRVLIENHLGVCEYEDTVIRVRVKNGSICVLGCNLELARMTKGVLVISGRIEAVQLHRG